MSVTEETGFQQRIGKIETLIHTLEQAADPATRADAQDLVQAILDLHGAGLARVLDRLAEAGAPGLAVVDALGRDDLVGSLLLLHGLHPLDLEARVQQALDSVRPYLRSHGGEVAFLGVSEGVVRLRMEGSCHGCPSSASTMKHSIEEAILAAAPDVTAIVVEGVVEPPPAPSSGFVSVGQLLGGNDQRNGTEHAQPGCHDQTIAGPPR